MFDTVSAVVQQADMNTDCLQHPFWDRVAIMVQHRLIERHVSFHRVRTQAVRGHDVVDVAVRSSDALIKRLQFSFRVSERNCVYPDQPPLSLLTINLQNPYERQ